MGVQIDAVGLTVKDMAKSLRFYRLLGLDIPEGQEKESHAECISPNGWRVMWDTEELIRGIDPDWTEPTGQRITLGFKCDTKEEVDQKYAELISEGYEGYKEPWDAFWGQRYAVILDPDGNKVDLFC